MTQLGNGLSAAEHHEDALSVNEAELSMERRLGASEDDLLATQTNLAGIYAELGHHEKAQSMERDVYSARLRLDGEEHEKTLRAANNYADSLMALERFDEAKSLMRKTIPVARRVLGEGTRLTLKTRWNYAKALYRNASATLDDLREAVATLDELTRTARRVLGGTNPVTTGIEDNLRRARALLAAREGGDVGAVRAALDATRAT